MGKIILNNIEYGIGTPNISNVDTTNLVKKDSIVTAIDDTCTDEQVPTAKAVHTAIQNVSVSVPADVYSKTEVDDLLADKADSTDIIDSYTKDEVDNLLNAKVDTDDVVDAYSKEEVNNLLDAKADSTDIIDAYTKGEVDTLLTDKADSSAIIDAYTKDETNDLLDAKVNVDDLVDAYSKTEVDDLLADKADTDDLIDAYSKTEVDNLLANKADSSAIIDAYSKTEVDGLLTAKVNISSVVFTLSSANTDDEIPSAKAVHDKFQEVFQNVDNGKDLIASAITDKGINTSKDDTFETMANNINNISSIETGVKCTFGEPFDVQAPFDVKKGDVVNFNYSLGDTLELKTLCNNMRINNIGFSKSSKIMWLSVTAEPWLYLYKKNDTTGAWDLLCTGATLSLNIYPSSVNFTIDDKYAVIQNTNTVNSKFKQLIKIDGTEVTALRRYTTADINLDNVLIFTGYLDELVVDNTGNGYAYLYSINPTTYDLLKSDGETCYSTMFYKQGNTYYGFGDIYKTGTYGANIYTQKITDNGDGTYTISETTDNRVSIATYDTDLPNKGIYYNNAGTYIAAYYTLLVAVNVSNGEIHFTTHDNNSSKSKITFAAKKDNKIYLFNKNLAIFNSFNLDTNQFERVDDMYTLDIYNSNGLAIFELWQLNDSPYSRYIAVNKKSDNMFYISEKGKKSLGNSFAIPNNMPSEIYGNLFIQNLGITDSAKNIASYFDKSFNYFGVNYVVEKDATSGQTTQLKEVIL